MAKKEKAEIKGLKVKCFECNKTVVVPFDAVDFYSNSNECGLCGSHGETTVDFHCANCNSYHEVVTAVW